MFLGIQIINITPKTAIGITAIIAFDQLFNKSTRLQLIFFVNTNTFVMIVRMFAKTKPIATPNMSY